MKRIALFLCLLLALPVAAQYPDRTVTLLTGYPAGGLVDVVARVLAEGMKAKFPKGLVIQIKPGAAGSEAIEDPKFAKLMAERGIDVDYRPGEALRADLWREYKVHTDILRRIGMLKN